MSNFYFVCRRTLRVGTPTWRSVALALMLAPLAAAAQTSGAAPELQDWRAANDAVAQFKRGHIDLLKWERANLATAPAAAPGQPGLMLMAPEDMVRQAWARHPDLVKVQNRLGPQTVQLVAHGRLDAVDPSVQRSAEDLGELLEVANEARKAWVEAVAARKALRFRQAAVVSAEAGNELGRRMVGVGNWSPLQAAPLQLALSGAQADLLRAQLASKQADGALRKILKLGAAPVVLGLPDAFPEFPAQAFSREQWAQRLVAVQAFLPGAAAALHQVASEEVFEVYHTGHALARAATADVLPLRRFITQETLLHYNGMLKSVWDLLDEVRNQATAEVDAIDALRDFWLAEADLQWTLLGGVPARPISLDSGATKAAGSAAH